MVHSIRSWNLKKFRKEYGIKEAERVLGVTTRQAVYAAELRQIRILEMSDGNYEAHESKLLNTVPIEE